MAFTDPTNVTVGSVLTAIRYNEDVVGNWNMFGAAWTNYTPTFVNLTQGDGTLFAKQLTVGKVVMFYVSFTFGSTSSMGGSVLSVTLPTAASRLGAGVLWGEFLDAGVNGFPMMPSWSSTTVIRPAAINAAGTYASRTGVSTNVPFGTAWGTDDAFYVGGVYEAA
jgi:hypothetical protein